MIDLAIRQRFLQLCHASVGDSSAPEVERFETSETNKVNQSGVGHLGTREVEPNQSGEAVELRQSRVCDKGPTEPEEL